MDGTSNKYLIEAMIEHCLSNVEIKAIIARANQLKAQAALESLRPKPKRHAKAENEVTQGALRMRKLRARNKIAAYEKTKSVLTGGFMEMS